MNILGIQFLSQNVFYNYMCIFIVKLINIYEYYKSRNT